MDCKKSYYAVIPATVRYDKKIMTGAKLLYGEITALCNEKGYCWATNEYFANLYGVSKRTIINWINSLADAGYIQTDIKYKEGTNQIEKRMISLPDTPIKKKEVKCAEPQERDSTYPCEENFITPDVSDFTTPSEKNFTTPMKEISHPSEESFITPSEKNFTENITYKNNTNNITLNIDEKIKKRIFDYTENENLREALFKFVEHRENLNCKLSDYSIKLLFNQLDKFTKVDSKKTAILNQSILGGYKLIFPLRKENEVKEHSYDLEEWEEWTMRPLSEISPLSETSGKKT